MLHIANSGVDLRVNCLLAMGNVEYMGKEYHSWFVCGVFRNKFLTADENR
ncbi:MAG TPA: hypothetical protein V6D28_28025 [Leptolyngbyaceae cyanobacterium]